GRQSEGEPLPALARERLGNDLVAAGLVPATPSATRHEEGAETALTSRATSPAPGTTLRRWWRRTCRATPRRRSGGDVWPTPRPARRRCRSGRRCPTSGGRRRCAPRAALRD